MELIYSIKNIFDSSTEQGCLSQYEVEKYHIPAYQRGYKWGSTENGAVSILLSDFYEAFTKAPTKEYYLQYITVKQNTNLKHLELIDGQQRITTLSILLSVFSALLNEDNIAASKLDYAVRSTFFQDYFYNVENLKKLLGTPSWDEFLDSNENDMDKQDIFHFYEAAKKINSFISHINKQHQSSFYDFIVNKVKIIVNAVEAHIESETVFKNLNSNKVPLTEVELIKGLFITRVGRENDTPRPKTFVEINEIRGRVGQQWDEITSWASDSRTRSFYFNDKTGMHQFLLLVAITLGYKETKEKTDFPVFNFFLKQDNFQDTFNNVIYTYRILSDWYSDAKKYNLLGYVRFTKNSGCNTLEYLKKLLNEETTSSFFDKLNEKKSKLLEGNLNEIRFGESNDKIHAILLYLNVFCDDEKNDGEESSPRFNFYDFIRENWTLEHIFPQSLEGKNAVLSEDNKKEIFAMLGGENSIDENVVSIIKKEERSDDEKQVYYNLLQSSEYLNSLGNMCLLTGKDNSSNGCMFFKDKRTNILKRLQKGSFVPKHTFDVFSKMITTEMSQHAIDTWNKADIDVHLNWIEERLKPSVI